MVEEFLEDINSILNTGEVPNLFEKDELEQVLAATRPKANGAGINEENRDEVRTETNTCCKIIQAVKIQSGLWICNICQKTNEFKYAMQMIWANEWVR